MPTIHTRIEAARGCGYRKPGGLYLVSDGSTGVCCKLPFELSVCPCCGAGVKFSRGFTWVNSSLFDLMPCTGSLPGCPLGSAGNKMGLLWVGEKFYSRPADFVREANTRGISRRIATVPHDFEIGKTWIALAHIHALVGDPHRPGVFSVFRPSRIEYIVTGSETEEELVDRERRGFTLVRVIRDIDTQTKLLQ